MTDINSQQPIAQMPCLLITANGAYTKVFDKWRIPDALDWFSIADAEQNQSILSAHVLTPDEAVQCKDAQGDALFEVVDGALVARITQPDPDFSNSSLFGVIDEEIPSRLALAHAVLRHPGHYGAMRQQFRAYFSLSCLQWAVDALLDAKAQNAPASVHFLNERHAAAFLDGRGEYVFKHELVEGTANPGVFAHALRQVVPPLLQADAPPPDIGSNPSPNTKAASHLDELEAQLRTRLAACWLHDTNHDKLRLATNEIGPQVNEYCEAAVALLNSMDDVDEKFRRDAVMYMMNMRAHFYTLQQRAMILEIREKLDMGDISLREDSRGPVH